MAVVDGVLQKCGGCGGEAAEASALVRDKKQNRGYLCASCRGRYASLLKPDSIRNFWMCNACKFRVLAGTDVDARIDEVGGNKCPHCGTDLTHSLVNLKNDRPTASGIIGEPLE